ncbi:HEPN domain-containing protein [Micromonospora sp. KC721]|uniref:HEPN domain-containing protein n=1 Tax=Micromonospora sp. KC721 TaxID=2530380 RepID=UPI001044B32B|nr:HEPN domain-containing protein [Micromonospora sp. KC721]TDB78213.1 hypothetical protein E1182_16180 [Micromonospora sp. KC721]
MPSDQFDAARQAFGDAFIKYVLNIEGGSSLDEVVPTSVQGQCVAFLESLTVQIMQSELGYQRDWLRTLALVPGPGGSGTPIATAMRQKCGGVLPDVVSDDAVESVFLECVRDAYPVLLLPVEDESKFRHPGLVPFSVGDRLESANRLRVAVLADDSLRRLFPDFNGSRGSSYLTSEAGDYWTLQIESLPQTLISYALLIASVDRLPTVEEAVQQAREVLAVSRALARGERVQLPVLVGLSNIELGRSVEEVDLVVGRLVRPTIPAVNRLGPRREPTVTAILVTTASQKIIKVDHADEFDFGIGFSEENPKNSALEAARQEVQNNIDRARYSLLLASEGDLIAALVQRTTRLSPLDSGASVAIASNEFGPYGSTILDQAAAGRASDWALRVSREHPRSLNIGMRRLLSAATARLDPMDGFIDAVMCWENLFGEAQETSFKVCGSLAMLLESGDELKRADLFSRLKKLYDTRSRLVHGSDEPDWWTAMRHRDEAVNAAINAMRRAYDVPRLLELSSGTERYKRVLLGVNPSRAK